MRVSYLTINIKIIKFKRSNSKSMVLHSNDTNAPNTRNSRWKVCYFVFFKNTRILKFKSQLTITFFAAVNHLNGPLRFNGFKRSWIVICHWWITIPFACFCVSRFVACDRDYDWRQRKTQFWRRFFNFRVRMFVKSEVRITHEKLIMCWNIRLN